MLLEPPTNGLFSPTVVSSRAPGIGVTLRAERSLLLIGNDSALSTDVSEALTPHFGPTSIGACDGSGAALERLAGNDYDAVLIDIEAPGMDGVELVLRLREGARDVPLVLIGGSDDSPAGLEALSAGAFDLVPRPLNRYRLAAALSRAIEVRELRRRLNKKQEQLDAQMQARALERRATERSADLRMALKEKEEFLGLVSHELRTPATVIYGNVEFLNAHATALDEATRASAMSDLRQETRRLLRIIENLLVLGRMEYGARSPGEPVLLRKLVEKQVESHLHYYPTRQIEVRIGPLPVVSCDPTQFELVITNLLSNAEKYSSRATPIEIEAKSDERRVRISVCDRGPGIERADWETIFTPFYHANGRAPAHGVGIGLAVCKRLVEAQGGEISVKPRPGGGSEFVIELQVEASTRPFEDSNPAESRVR